jgi:hypothetical protein
LSSNRDASLHSLLGSVRVSVQKAKGVDEDGHRVVPCGRDQSTDKEDATRVYG